MKHALYLVALFTVLTSPSHGAEPAKRDQARLASDLKIPHIKMQEATPEEAFDFIRLKSKEIDPAGLGVQVVVQPVRPAVAPKTQKPEASALESALEPFPGAAASKGRREAEARKSSVTFELKNVTVLAAIQKAAEQAQMKVEAKRDAIVVRPK